MKRMLPLLTLGIAVAALCGASAPVLAADDAVAQTVLPDGIVSPTVPEAAPSTAVELLFANVVQDDAELSGNRGGADVHLSDMRVVGSVSDVDASDLLTGHNIITEGGLANANGMPMVIQNSGNGVLIQNAVIVNLDMTQ